MSPTSKGADAAKVKAKAIESGRRNDDADDDGGREGKYEKLTPAQEMRKQREFSNLSNVFADIFSGAQAGEVIFKGQFNGAKAKVITTAGGSQGSQGETGAASAAGEEQGEAAAEEDRDLVLARALQAIEDDAYRTMKRMEEEDERYARELARSENGAADASTPAEAEATERPTSGRRRLLISSSEGDDSAAAATMTKGWRELVRQDSLTERDRRLALQLLEEEDREKRKREAEDEALAKSLSTGDGGGEPAGKRRRTDETAEAAEMTSDELIVRLLQEEEEETHRRERAKKAKEEGAMSRKLIEKLMRAEEMDHDEWVRSELAQIDEREAMMTTKKKKKAWPGFGFGWGDKERMREKAEGKIVGDSDWKSTRFFADTSVLEGFLFSCAKQNGSVTITNVMKYDLVEKFDRKWSEFKATYGSTAAESQTTLAFHGTRGDLIPSITNKGLLVPGTAPGVEHVTDSGWYGCGIYLSPNPDVAQGYAADGKMLVCAVLMGRIYTCPEVMEGVGCRRGYDSHTSPCGEELVLFDAAQVLPCYLVVFGAS